MPDKREELIKRNKNFIQLPMPNLSLMTDEELENRASMWEKLFEMKVDEDEDEDI